MTSNSQAETDFTPVTTFQGIALGKLLEDLSAERVAVIGTGVQAKAVCKRLLKNETYNGQIVFVENNVDRLNAPVMGQLVMSFDQLLDELKASSAGCVLIKPPFPNQEMQQLLEAALVLGAECVSSISLARPEAIVEVASSLGSISSVTSKADHPKEMFMDVKKFGLVLEKLVREFPELHSIDLSGRGDPIHHPDLQSIISLASEQTFTTVVTRLSCAKPKIDKLLQSDVDQIVVDFSDILSEDAAQMLLGNLAYLGNMVRQENSEVELRCRFQKRKSNLKFLSQIEDHCATNGIRLISELAYPDPYDKILHYRLTGESQREIDDAIWDVDFMADKALAQRDRACLCQRVFPVINSRTEVEVCHLYVNPKLSSDYLAEDGGELIERRSKFNQCKICQSEGLHRLDLHVLERST